MPTAFDEAFQRVKQLVADFQANEEFFLSSTYSEAQARKDFVDKFFIALGWDVNHDTQKNPYEQEVKIERNESGSQRHADYAFFLAPDFHEVRFFVEAKKPDGDFGSPGNYFQTLRYGWGGKTPLAVLTNFDELHILDSRFEPDIKDTLSRLVKRFSRADYCDAEKFAEIYWLFSREAVANRSLEKFAEHLPRPRSRAFRRGFFKGGDQSIDEKFLSLLDGYRQILAGAFKVKNPHLDGAQLTEATQRTLDRLVFIRFLEDKGIEPNRLVEKFGTKGNTAWEDFIQTSLRLDRIYNGIVFKRNETLDAPGFEVDDRKFRSICEELTDPTASYTFNNIPIHILGSIYERFLGKIITDKANVIEKPEVRNAGGVFYTPEYIVRYIVGNTVGKLIENKTPAQIAEMRFADIACGSGSFLLGVFDLLIRHHAKFYNENPGKVKKGDCVKRDDGLHLSLQKKREILVNNIFGVDIDAQAVEVAQLSLYLKLLEDETIASASAFQTEFHYTLLPSLDKNIVCGNSLVGTDILQTVKFTDEEEKKLNPMDFWQRFPEIFRRTTSSGELHDAPAPISDYTMPGVPLHGSYSKISYQKKKSDKPVTLPEMEFDGGFDAIVGNPPYVSVQSGFIAPREYDYFARHFQTMERIGDFFGLFTEKAIARLLKDGGYYGYIIPSTIQGNKSFAKLRQFFLTRTQLRSLVHFADGVFDNAVVPTNVIIAQKHLNSSGPIEVIAQIQDFSKGEYVRKIIPQEAFNQPPDFLFNLAHDSTSVALLEKIKSNTEPLATFLNIKEGIKTGDDKQFLSKKPFAKNSFKLLKGRDIERYKLESSLFIHYDREKLSRPQTPEHFLAKEKLLIRRVGDSLVATYDNQQHFCVHTLYTARPKDGCNLSLKFLLGLINSKLLQFYYRQTTPQKGSVFPEVRIYSLNELPIRRLNLDKSADKACHNQIIKLVDQIFSTKTKFTEALTDKDRDFYKNKCDALDRQIDALVHQLYGLTNLEIQAVERATA